MDEFSFIDSIKQTYYKQPSLIKGIGDDAAVFRPSEDIVTAVDTFVEHVHFAKETMAPVHIGYRLLAANLSDLAAMGAVPAYYMVSIVIPPKWQPEEVTELFRGMKELAGRYRMDLIGGDTVSGKELAITLTIFGFTKKNRARYRSDAEPGDVVFATGTLGDSQAGYYVLTHPGDYLHEEYFIKRHRLPEPRVDFSRQLDFPRVALNDISDGIGSEAHEIAAASDVSITLLDECIPTSAGYSQFPADLQAKWKYFGGEDFELIGTISPDHWEDVQRAAERTNTQVTKIGYVSSEDPGSVFVVKQGTKMKLSKAGYTHLK
jgi:thiamine-monophosphate kinase